MARERILVALQGGESDDKPIRAAMQLAPAYQADVRGLFVEPDPASYMLWTGPGAAGASVVTTAIDAVRQEAEKAAKDAERRFNAAAEEAGPASHSFRRITDSPTDSAQQARLVRLLVACPEAAAGRGPLADFVAACLIDEACPIFVTRSGDVPPRRIAIAWDGSREAAKAAFAAAPLIGSDTRVVILSSDRNLDYQDRSAAAPNRLSNWLRARGVEADMQRLEGSGPVGELILSGAEGCDLIVAGAYGHSRIAQSIFGGVTKRLLSAVDGPSLLMAH